ncbi:MAG: chemotaxis response regulator protein-glutamate methylesterase [Pseudomonadota bacterium]|nr:chemotaxis response regulator protein-glutamate methylesterase [Pseudomonadota bacterium]
MAIKNKIKVLIIDDSAVVRTMLTDMLGRDPQIEVVGTAHDAYMARDKIKKLKPDVLTLDVEMPKMDGITFLSNLMRLHPMPVLMVSTLTEKGARVTMDALAYGAIDFVCKPKIDISHSFLEYADELREKVKTAARARVRQYVEKPVRALANGTQGPSVKYSVDEVIPGALAPRKHFRTTDKLIAIGASTGGTEAIREVLEQFPLDTPGIVVAQHIPVSFSKAFAERVNQHCAIQVKEANDGDPILPGHAYIAPGNRHLMVVRDGARWRCRLSDDVPVNRHKPSVDVLFRSVANAAGPNAIGVILTGMGKDGAQGLKDMLGTGAHTIAQDEASSVVWGMPGAAVEIGASKDVLPLDRISERVMNVLATQL